MARKIALILGLFVALLPYLGFPESLDTWFYSASGLIIAFLAWSGKRPPPPSSIEDMEGELQDATHEGSVHHSASEIHSGESSSPVSSMNGGERHESVDTMVSVAFAKQRSRNLKKRITQEGSPTSL